MANYNYLCCLDYETGGKNASNTQAMSMACCIIDPVRLEIVSNGDFYSLIRADFDEETCLKNGVEVPSDEAMNITGITREQSEAAPSWQEVHNRFETHIKKFWTGNSVWKAPLFCGFNSMGYDLTILNRACEKWGSFDKEYKKNALFHPIHFIDVLNLMFLTTESKKGWFSLSLDTLRNTMGITKEGAHNALTDVRHTSAILIRWLRWFRKNSAKLALEDSFKDLDILDFYDTRPIE